jgi:phage regulator Rha-like protein
MNLITSNQTMTSREIAELLESRHDSVKRTIERLVASSVISQPPMEDGEKSANGVIEKLYKVGKRDSYIIVAQLSPEFTARLVDRWQELEQGAVKALPKSFSEALRQLADATDELTEKTLQLEAAKPAVAFVEKFVEARSSKCLSDVAKLLGKKPQAFIQQLNADRVIFRRGGSWIPHQNHLDAGRFTVKAGEASGHAFEQTRVEPRGIEWLARNYGDAV